jgi:hypothetical protein
MRLHSNKTSSAMAFTTLQGNIHGKRNPRKKNGLRLFEQIGFQIVGETYTKCTEKRSPIKYQALP